MPNANARPGSEVASAKSWLLTVRSPIRSTSFETKPSMLPEPYWISNELPFARYVLDCVLSYFWCRKHAMEVHDSDGTHRFAEPVSRITLKSCGGVPSLMSAKYWALRKSVRGTWWPSPAFCFHASSLRPASVYCWMLISPSASVLRPSEKGRCVRLLYF